MTFTISVHIWFQIGQPTAFSCCRLARRETLLNYPFKKALTLLSNFAVRRKIGILLINIMSKHIPSELLLQFAYDLEEFEATSLAKKVTEKAVESGFLTLSDTPDNRSKLAWIEKVTLHAEDAYNLEDIADGEDLEVKIANFKQLLERRDKQVKDILELLAKHIIDAAPRYKG